VVARYGVEEFAILLPGVQPDEARRLAKRIHDAVRRAPVAVTADTAITVTVSVGLACRTADKSANPEELVALADRLLYTAKETGRDRVAAERPGLRSPRSVPVPWN
jgi:two-component system cell cycle response regulator